MAGDRQAHADPHRVLGADKGFEHLVGDLLAHAMAQVIDPDLEERPGLAPVEQAGMQGEGPGLLRRAVVGLPAVDQHLGEHFLENFRVRLDRHVPQRIVDLDRRGELVVPVEAGDPVLQQALHGRLGDRGVDVDDERTELPDDGDDALHGDLDVGQDLLHLLGLFVMDLDEVDVADRDGEQVVEIVRDPFGDGADRRGPARFLQTPLQVDHLSIDRNKPKLSLHARERFVEIDRLGDVVHRPHAESLELALLGRPSGDENDRDRAGFLVGLQALADFDPVHVRHHDVEQDQVGLFPHDDLEAVAAVEGGQDLQPLPLQLALKQLDVDRLVVDHQDFGGGAHADQALPAARPLRCFSSA